MKYCIALGLIAVLISACHSGNNGIDTITKDTLAVHSLPLKIPKDTAHVAKGVYIFGIYCGECSGHCAHMFRYAVTDSGARLDTDPTDNFSANANKCLSLVTSAMPKCSKWQRNSACRFLAGYYMTIAPRLNMVAPTAQMAVAYISR